MDEPGRARLIEQCLAYLRQVRFPRPLPSTKQEYVQWIDRYDALPRDEELEDAWMDLGSDAYDRPDFVWGVILELLRRTDDHDDLGMIGAGVLETFIAQHGTAWARTIDEEIRQNARLAAAIRSVRGIQEHPDLLARIQDVVGQPGG